MPPKVLLTWIVRTVGSLCGLSLVVALCGDLITWIGALVIVWGSVSMLVVTSRLEMQCSKLSSGVDARDPASGQVETSSIS